MKRSVIYVVAAVFILYWLFLRVTGTDPESGLTTLFSSSYVVIALLGGVFGLLKSKEWGGFKSSLGKAIGFLSTGLIATTLGSLVLTVYNVILDTDPGYPSVAELFYILGIISYIFGVLHLAKTLRSWASIKSRSLVSKLLILLTPILMVGLTVVIYSLQYDTSEATTLSVATDFIYAFLQATYAVIAIGALLTSGQLYGGYLRKAVVMVLIGLIIQYAADSNYSFQQLAGTWQTAGYGELLYLLAYTAIAYSLQLFSLPKVNTQDAAEDQ